MMGIEGNEDVVVFMEAHKLSPRLLNDTNESITSSSEPPSPTLSSATTESTPAVAALRELPAARMNEQKKASLKEPIIAVKGECVPCQSKPKPKQGTYLEPSQFSFKELSIALRAESSVVQATTKSTSQPRRPQRTPTQPQASTPKSDTDDVNSTANQGKNKHPKSCTAPQAHSRGHSSRVDALLRIYLGDQAQGTDAACTSENKSNSNILIALDEREALGIGCPSHTTAAATPLNIAGAVARKAGLKPIMQVKTEQDAAIKSLQHTPRTFHAKPVPVEVAERRLKHTAVRSNKNKKAAAAAGVEAEENNSFTARPVPLSTTEARYAMLVADAQILRFSSGKSEGELQPARGEGGASIAADEARGTELKRPSSALSRGPDAENNDNGVAVLPPVIEEDEFGGIQSFSS